MPPTSNGWKVGAAIDRHRQIRSQQAEPLRPGHDDLALSQVLSAMTPTRAFRPIYAQASVKCSG
jgi:hypothetical protein